MPPFWSRKKPQFVPPPPAPVTMSVEEILSSPMDQLRKRSVVTIDESELLTLRQTNIRLARFRKRIATIMDHLEAGLISKRDAMNSIYGAMSEEENTKKYQAARGE